MSWYVLISKSAHAGDAPWEGTNALDAAFLAYSSVAVLRQQIKPDHRVHGVIQGSETRAANGTVWQLCRRTTSEIFPL